MVKQKKLKILYFCNGSGLSSAKSGGGTRMVEIIKRLPKNLEINIVGTVGDQKMFIRENISNKIKFTKILSAFWQTKKESRFDRLLGYFVSTIHSLLIIPFLPKVNLVYSPSDVFCDIVPGFFYKILKKTKWIVISHHLCPLPWQRKGSFIINACSFLAQKFSFLLIGLGANRLLVYNTSMGKAVSRSVQKMTLRKIKVKKISNGVNLKAISQTSQSKIIYDACFAGGLRTTKGIFNLINIWAQVCQKKPKAKLAIAGQGTDDIRNQVKKQVNALGLNNNVALLGNLSSSRLYSLMKASKIFVSASSEEGWGIAIYEALSCGLPVIAYDLPAYPLKLSPALNLVPYKNDKRFAQKILFFLQHKKQYAQAQKAIDLKVKIYSWNQVAQQEVKILSTVK